VIPCENCIGICGKRLTSRYGDWHKRRSNLAFTILELLIVISVTIALAGLILATSGYVQKKGARSRAAAEIAAISAALENYKTDNGIYPTDADIAALDARTQTNTADYEKAGLSLYKFISGDADNDTNRVVESKSYFAFKPNQLNPQDPTTAVAYIRDPFGNSYGYSTAQQTTPTKGYNPTFDLWSTANSTDPAQWIKNW
jgi:type II secretory pathway pseudopilin PulG